jgi:uncharacterized membrane protein
MTLARRYEITRLEAFSDAVFAFALTLLVVSLEAPRTYAELMQLVRGFLPFAACFALLIYIWYEHSAFFSKYGLHDRTTTILNAVLLFVVLFYVYPLKYLFTLTFAIVLPQLRHEGAPQTLREMTNLFMIYGLGFVAVFGVLALLYYWAWRRRTDIDLTPLEARDARGEIGTHLVSVLIGLISIGWAELAPGNLGTLAGFAYFLMGPAHWVYGESNGRRRQAFLRLPQSPPKPDAA